MTPPTVLVRDARAGDLAAITAIYRHHVRHGLGTFEEEAPTIEEMTQRHRDITMARGLPWLVAADGFGTILGYVYAGPYRPRSAYRFTVEDSIYVAPGATRQGIGHTLLAALVDRCTAAGLRQMIAVIGDSDNQASIGVHQRSGFRHIGILSAVGYKHGAWIDAVLMQRTLGSGASVPPT